MHVRVYGSPTLVVSHALQPRNLYILPGSPRQLRVFPPGAARTFTARQLCAAQGCRGVKAHLGMKTLERRTLAASHFWKANSRMAICSGSRSRVPFGTLGLRPTCSTGIQGLPTKDTAAESCHSVCSNTRDPAQHLQRQLQSYDGRCCARGGGGAHLPPATSHGIAAGMSRQQHVARISVPGGCLRLLWSCWWTASLATGETVLLPWVPRVLSAVHLTRIGAYRQRPGDAAVWSL